MWMVVRIPAGDITNLHYNFVVAKPLVKIIAANVYIYKRFEKIRLSQIYHGMCTTILKYI